MNSRLARMLILAVCASGPAVAQVLTAESATNTVPKAYNIETFGMFQAMMLTGDFSPKVNLSEIVTKHPTTGVGAVADAIGEITIYGGKLIITYGKPAPAALPENERASLLAVATTTAWQEVKVTRDVAPENIEAFLATVAGEHGLKAEDPFPFQIRGTVGPYEMHVNAAPTNGPHGMGQPMAVTVQSKGERIDGMVAGLFVSPDLVGIVSHGGTRTHAHWVAPDEKSTAHLDRWGVRSGSVLSIPRQ